MDNSSPNSVLRRKAHAAKEVWQARAMSPAKALRLSVARAADDLWDLAIAASGISLTEESLEAALDSLPEEGMILLLEGPEGVVGAAHLPFPVVAGLVEAQTVGQVIARSPEVRPVTRTDAAMVAPLIDETLTRFEGLLAEHGLAPWARGFRFGTMMESARMLSLALKATDFHVIRFSLDLAATREGDGMLMMPVAEAPGAATGEAGGAMRDGALEAQILRAPTELRAVLHRLSMPLSAIRELQAGEVLTIPREAMERTEVEVAPRTVIGTCKLGQVNGMRALRMNLGQQPVRAGGGPEDPPGLDPPAAEAPDAAMAAAPMQMVAMDMPEEAEGEAEMPAFAAAPMAEEEDLLGDLPDLGDLPGMSGPDKEEGEGELPALGALPMAALPEID